MTKILFQSLPDHILKLIKSIGAYADQRNVSAYLVGGIVRDLILGKENLDIDIVLEVNAIDFAKTFAKENGFSFVAHSKFMTASMHQENNIRIDFTTARKESYSSSGALPDVSPATIQADLFRRDFTMNAIAVSINKGKFGEIVDFYDGQGDLEQRKIRVFHDKSFIDDPTRILRAIRFEQRFDFELDVDTMNILKDTLEQDIIYNVTLGRYFEEFKKICEEQSPAKCLRRLFSLKILQKIFPDFSLDEDRLKLIESIEIYLSVSKLENFPVSRWLVYFMAFVDDLSLKDTKNLLDKFLIPKKDQKKIISLKTQREIIERLCYEKMRPSQIQKVLSDLSNEEIIFFSCRNNNPSVSKCIDNFLDHYRWATLSISGEDLKEIGFKDGKRIGVILEYLLAKKIDGKIKTKKDELREAEKEFYTRSL
ncbi:MAG: CCA tRNA nucleotidyltransferase [Candidatus Omnitrophica bacterium]|nr:CCA tRNA nucleotidyltransferase [Candidatus Omnitrophota bacterium]